MAKEFKFYIQVADVRHSFFIDNQEVGATAIMKWVDALKAKAPLVCFSELSRYANMWRTDSIQAIWVEPYDPTTDTRDFIPLQRKLLQKEARGEDWQGD